MMLVIKSIQNWLCPHMTRLWQSHFKVFKARINKSEKFCDFKDAKLSLLEYMNFYNTKYPHSANNGLTPAEKVMSLEAFSNILLIIF